MTQALVLLSVTLLLLAGAIELWWGSAARRQQRRSSAHIEQTLGAGAPRMSSVAAAQQAEARAMVHEGLYTDMLFLRAGLPIGWRMPTLLTTVGLVLTLLGTWRIDTPWASPVLLGAYTAVAWLWLRARTEKQRQLMMHQLPDFLDGMVRLVGIGNSLPMAFQAASVTVQMPLRTLVDRTMQLVRTGLDLDRALQAASRPYRLDVLDLLHVVLGTGSRLGGRSDLILQRISDFMRDLNHARQELHAITAETRLSAWVLGLLPVVVSILMTLLNPEFFTPMFSQPLGHHILLLALLLESLGGFLLYRMAKSL